VFKLSPDIQKNKKKGLKRRGVGMKRVELVMREISERGCGILLVQKK
jgi:hypothetical protein